MSEERKIAEILFISYALQYFLGHSRGFQILLFVVQPGSVVHWRAVEGLIPATALR